MRKAPPSSARWLVPSSMWRRSRPGTRFLRDAKDVRSSRQGGRSRSADHDSDFARTTPDLLHRSYGHGRQILRTRASERYWRELPHVQSLLLRGEPWLRLVKQVARLSNTFGPAKRCRKNAERGLLSRFTGSFRRSRALSCPGTWASDHASLPLHRELVHRVAPGDPGGLDALRTNPPAGWGSLVLLLPHVWLANLQMKWRTKDCTLVLFLKSMVGSVKHQTDRT